MYADRGTFTGDANSGPASAASVGMGLVTLCIADALKLDGQAEAKVILTLESLNGKTAGFSPPVNRANGFFRHFFDMETGAGSGEYSSIDTGILVAGALFCKTYFRTERRIGELADALYLSIRWERAIADPEGGIYMVMDSLPAAVTRPFNEYMLVGWLARNAAAAGSAAEQAWLNSYGRPEGLPHIRYGGVELLTDHPSHYLPGFTIQFPYYLVHAFAADTAYLRLFRNHAEADRLWFRNQAAGPDYAWGTGAGSNVAGYTADRFDANPFKTVSPQIMAGFLPADPAGIRDDLGKLWESGLGRYAYGGAGARQVLWRFSLANPEWKAASLQGVDFSTEVFGLAAHPNVLGAGWFATYNDFAFPDRPNAVIGKAKRGKETGRNGYPARVDGRRSPVKTRRGAL